MKRRAVLFGIPALVLAAAFAIGGRKLAPVAAAPARRTPVLVELFTSEGCSSCPPADAVLSDLERRQTVPGVQVIALGEHVDYWNNANWADRFSSHAFSVRQNGYAQSFHNDTVYTPQMVVDGRAEFVGSDTDRAAKEIARAALAPKADVQVALSTTGRPALQIRIGNLPTVTRGDKALVSLAVTEDGLTSQVRGGENGGRSLSHSAVVRQMEMLGTAQPGAIYSAQPALILAPGWNRAHLQAIVFVQEQKSRRVLGAATLPLG